MKIRNQAITKTKAKYVITASETDLVSFLNLATKHLADKVKVPGFRPGKAPSEMIVKHADQNELQNEVLNHAVNDLYVQSTKEITQKVIGEPKISISKFVPYSSLELSVEVPVIVNITIPTYAQLKQPKSKLAITSKMIDENLAELQKRSAKNAPVKRPAKLGDMVVIDFDGSDTKTREKLAQASAKAYQLTLGDKNFIPGFEEKLVGLGIGKTTTFDLTFPKDYFDKTFAYRKVTFKVTLNEVNSIELPKLDDAFAKTIGPFTSLDHLKTELKKQLEAEADRQAVLDQGNKILDNLATKTVVEIDSSLIDSESELLLNNAKKNAISRGQTWQEFLASLGKTETEYETEIKEAAKSRIKGGLAIGEIATNEGLKIESSELDKFISDLKRQYTDPNMQKELDSPEGRQELAMRLLTEKVINFIINK